MAAKHTENLAKSLATRTLRRPPPPRPRRPDVSFAAPSVARFVLARAVGSYVPALTRKAFEKFGFSTATLIMEWTGIVGGEIARSTAPERLKWPRGAGCDDETETGRGGATLVLRVDPARALDVEYRARQIIERINAYFGYRAVEALRLIQAPLPLSPARRAETGIPAAGVPPLPTSLASGKGDTTDDPLHAALTRLEQGIRRRHPDGRR